MVSLVAQCSYTLTGPGYVKRICSDLATLECKLAGLRLIDSVEGLGAGWPTRGPGSR